jgi:NTE family protein
MADKTDEIPVSETRVEKDSVKVIELAQMTDMVVENLAGPGKIALSLSGGGYRAMLFHLGTLWRLNELGYLPKLDRISSVSGGSITAALLGLNWSVLAFENGVARNFEPVVAKPLREIGELTIDKRAIVRGVLSLGSIGDQVTKAYRKLFHNSTLQDLPDRPRFVINATNVQSGVLWRFSKPYTWDYRVGQIKNPCIELAVAVAASAAFPPMLSPITLKFDESVFTPDSGTDLQFAPFRTKVVLTDGGVYDNLGLETTKQFDTILVSDAGGNLKPEGKPKKDWLRHLLRSLFIIDNQVRSLRKRSVIDAFVAGERKGAYWGIRTNIADYGLPDAFDCPFDQTIQLANVATRLKELQPEIQERLINWGYAVCDAAMRKHVDNALPKPSGFPYPKVGVG